MFSSMKFNIESVWSIFIFLNYVDMCWRTLISGLNSQGLVNTGPMDSSLTSISTRHSPQKSIKLLLIRMRMHAKEDKKWRQDMVSFSLCLLVFLPFFFPFLQVSFTLRAHLSQGVISMGHESGFWIQVLSGLWVKPPEQGFWNSLIPGRLLRTFNMLASRQGQEEHKRTGVGGYSHCACRPSGAEVMSPLLQVWQASQTVLPLRTIGKTGSSLGA